MEASRRRRDTRPVDARSRQAAASGDLADDDAVASLGRQAGGGQHESRTGDEPRGDPGQATAGLISGSVEEQRRC